MDGCGLRASRGVAASEEAEMKPTRKACLLGCAVFAASLAAVSDPAAARIECRGNFQMTKYGPIATPYCEEKQIAIVARSYGVKVTDSQVRNDPLTKVYLCQTLGNDVRLKGSCAGYGPDSYGRGR
jgi:hypothetical protein